MFRTPGFVRRLGDAASKRVGTGGGQIPTNDLMPLLGFISGFIVSNNTIDAAHDVDVSIGVLRDAADTKMIQLATTLGKQGDVAFAKGGTPGAPVGGLGPTVSLPVSGTIYVHAISEDATGDVDAYLDTSISGANPPVGWTFRRRVASRTTDVSNNLLSIRARELAGGAEEVLLDTPVNNLNTGAAPATRTNQIMSIPTGHQLTCLLAALAGDGVANQVILLSPDQADTAPSSTLFSLNTGTGDTNAGDFAIRTDSSAQITHRSVAATMNLTLTTRGWIDDRVA